jgi:hypothetical protein
VIAISARSLVLVSLALAAIVPSPRSGQAYAQSIVGPPKKGEPARIATIPTPEKFFGFQMGADRKLAHWDDMVRYYDQLGRLSPRVKVVNMGKTSEGRPFYALFISSPANLARLEYYRGINARIADPRGLSDDSLEALTKVGKSVVLQSMSMHSTEVGGSQMAVELIYDLVSRNDDETKRILDNVISIMIPSFNPDGQVMVTEWYRQTVGTDAEGSGPPSLYQKYAGHDNNRDAFQQNLPDSRYIAKLLFREWIPQAYVDHHHMGGNGARIYLPPYAEPVRPFADPIVWRELGWFGGYMATKEEEYGMSGVINDAVYSGWGHMGFHWITPFHNVAGMLTESASASLASPVTLTMQQLQGNTRNLMTYKEQTNFPNPWPGGTWHLRDIVERQKISAWATLDLAARNKEQVLRNMYLKGKNQTQRGANGTPKAFIVSLEDQHDPLTTRKMIQNLLNLGVEVMQAPQAFTQDGKSYGPGTYVVSMAQPKMGVVRWMLGRTYYPDNEYTRDADGNPIRPYDMATDVMAEFMGVEAVPANSAVTAPMKKVASAEPPPGRMSVLGPDSRQASYGFSGRLNDSWRAANLLWAKGATIRRIDKGVGTLRTGDYVVTGASFDEVQTAAKATGVDFDMVRVDATVAHDVKQPRIAMYQRYGGGNADEGWTRLLFEQFDQPYHSIFDPELKAGNLASKFDVLILPSDNPNTLTGPMAPAVGRSGDQPIGRGGPITATPTRILGGGGNAVLGGPGGGGGGGRGGRGGGRAGGGGAGGPSPLDPYRTGFGQDGIDAIRQFVEAGGTLITFAEAGSFAIERLELPIREVSGGRPFKEFWCPGCTLKITVDTASRLGYGMPENALATWLANSQAYEILPNAPAGTQVIAKFVDRDVLQSGWLLGESVIAGRPTMVSVPMGQGKVVLIGFRVQHRDQTHGTYKLLFNALQR